MQESLRYSSDSANSKLDLSQDFKLNVRHDSMDELETRYRESTPIASRIHTQASYYRQSNKIEIGTVQE